MPAGLSGVVAIAAGTAHSLALKSDGTAVAKGDNYYGETLLPAGSRAKWGQASLTCSPQDCACQESRSLLYSHRWERPN
jgi:alpha-tubulin suppressor-like RCC1 family protein